MIDELEYAKSVIATEIDGLNQLRDSIGSSLQKALEILYKIKGHVIISGMGKPGHIGRKIAATLSSTGTPSFFLHPAEASHGDMGVISSDDALVVLSLSGNTQELVSLLEYTKRFGIPIIGITANDDSLLAKASTVTILIPKAGEACPYNLAPTTSTTIMLVLGDVLALALLKHKEFQREDFKKLHPGGALGKQLLMVSDLMHTSLPLVSIGATMETVLPEMTQKSFGCAGVVDEKNCLVGVITDGDLRRGIAKYGVSFLSQPAQDVMSDKPLVVQPSLFALEATRLMNQNKITSLFVVQNDSTIGILHIHDCLRMGLA